MDYKSLSIIFYRPACISIAKSEWNEKTEKASATKHVIIYALLLPLGQLPAAVEVMNLTTPRSQFPKECLA